MDVSHNAIGLEGFRNLAASLEHLKLENLAVQGNGELTHETSAGRGPFSGPGLRSRSSDVGHPGASYKWPSMRI